MAKRLTTMQETWVRSLGWEDPLEKEMATHSSILAWKILELLQTMAFAGIHTYMYTHTHTQHTYTHT